MSIQYNLLNLPRRITYTDGSMATYTYNSLGEKLQVAYATSSLTASLPAAHVAEPDALTLGQTVYAGSTLYPLGGSLTLRNGRIDKLQFEEGYCQATEYSGNPSQDSFFFYYYDRDHLGNVRRVTRADRTVNGTVVQTMDYYPFGAQFCNGVTDSNVQSRRYNGKELDKMHGLDTYDYGARQYDPILGRWDRVDPLCEKYYSISPYAYCANNPVNAIDPDGKEVLPVLFEKLDQRGNAYGTPYRSSSKFVKAMTKFANTTYGNQFVSSFLPRGRKQYGVKGNGQYANYVFRIEEFNFSDPNEQFVTMGNVRGSFKVQEVNGKLNIIMSLDVAGQSENELIETITHELALHGYNIDEIIKAYEKGGMEAVNALRQKTSESAEHKDIQNKKKGGKQYHKTRKELVEQYTILNDVFNEKMSEYEKIYGF